MSAIDLNYACRLCLENNPTLTAIFNDNGEPESLLEKIQSCLFIEIYQADKVNKVCKKCANMVNEFYSFKIQVTTSQERLNLFIASHEREKLLAELDLEDHMKDTCESKNETQIGDKSLLIDRPYTSPRSSETSFVGEEKAENPLDLRCCNIFKHDPADPSKSFQDSCKPNKVHTCNECRKSFNSLRSLVKHLNKSHVKNQTFSCSTCNLTFTTEEALKSHSLTHKERYFCDKCLYSSFSFSNFKIHLMKHNAEFLIECSDCGKGFYRKETYREHRLKIHSNNALTYKCNICDKPFQCRNYLLKHQKIHDKSISKSYQCELCGKTFQTWKGIQGHMGIVHLGYRYTCDVCDKQLTSLQSLKFHKKTHTGEKSYICQECGKSFLRLGSLVVHRRTHTGEKPFTCQVCQKKFAQKSSLNVHARFHTGEKPYPCPHCPKRFITRTLMKTHLRAQHDMM